MAKVVSIDGSPIGSPGEPDDDVVALLERSLEMARSGELIGVAIVQVFHDMSVAWTHAGHTLDYAVVGSLQTMSWHLTPKDDE